MKKIYIGLFLISLATLALEISLTRLFSISLWYHFAFLVVSIAMLGFAAAGTFLSIKRFKNPLPFSSLLFSISAILGFWVVNNLCFDPFRAALDPWHLLVLILYYLFLGLPFFFSGIIITFILTKFQSISGKVYFYNLAGSAVGSLAVLLALSTLAEKTILVIALLGAIATFSFSFKNRPSRSFRRPPGLPPACLASSAGPINLRVGQVGNPKADGSPPGSDNIPRTRGPARLTSSDSRARRVREHAKHPVNLINLLLIISLLILIFGPSLQIRISPYKELNQALNYEEAKILDTQQNSFSQVDVVESPYVRYAPGLSSQFRDDLPEQKGITVDGAGLNAITKRQGVDFLNYLPTSIPFSLIENPKTLVLNAGAGLDVLTALENNAPVTAVESNPIIIDLLKIKFKYFSGNIFNQAEIFHDEGRSFIKNAGQYDVINISQAGQLASSSAGLYSFSENYLLTEESIRDYYEHLTDQGVLVITRWLSYPPKESLRLFSLAQTIPSAENKIAAFRSWTTFTLLLNKNDFSQERINKIKDFTEKNKFDLIYLAQSDFTPNRYSQFEEPYYYNAIQQILKDKQQFYDSYLFDVTPVTDEKPFYANFFKWSKVKELYQLAGTKWRPFFDSGFMLLFLFLQALILSLVFVLLPIRFFKKLSVKKTNLVYFACLGLGYLFVEIVLIQKFILFLGHITYAISTVIFAMLIFSSFGSLASQKYSINPVRNSSGTLSISNGVKKLPWLITTLVVLIIVYTLVLPALLNSLIGHSLLVKMLFTTLLIAPLAFIMGMPFPLGLHAINQQIIPWALAINGSASVLSTIMATLIALSTGYSFVLVLAALLYLVSVFFIKPSISAQE